MKKIIVTLVLLLFLSIAGKEVIAQCSNGVYDVDCKIDIGEAVYSSDINALDPNRFDGCEVVAIEGIFYIDEDYIFPTSVKKVIVTCTGLILWEDKNPNSPVQAYMYIPGPEEGTAALPDNPGVDVRIVVEPGGDLQSTQNCNNNQRIVLGPNAVLANGQIKADACDASCQGSTGNIDYEFNADGTNGSIGVVQGEGFTNVGCELLINLLPIELSYFEAEATALGNLLIWETVTESSNDFFDVQHSQDGLHFKSIQTVDGSGTTYTTRHYEFRHTSPAPGLNYYRLRQVDFDGAFSYSDILVVRTVPSLKEDGILVFPNPVKETLFVEGFLPDHLPESVYLINSTGQRQDVNVHFQNTGLMVNLPVDLPPGPYVICMYSSGIDIRKMFYIIP